MNRTLTATLTAAALSLGAAAPAATAAPAYAAGAPPVIHETFTPLPCKGAPSQRTTLELEGCAERQVLKSDRRIDGLTTTIYGKLPGPGRASFVTASQRWLEYRDSYCSAAASPAAGGSEAPVIVAQCLASQDAEHVTDLLTFLQDAF